MTSGCMVIILGVRSRILQHRSGLICCSMTIEVTVHPAARKTLPMLPVPLKSSSKCGILLSFDSSLIFQSSLPHMDFHVSTIVPEGTQSSNDCVHSTRQYNTMVENLAATAATAATAAAAILFITAFYVIHLQHHRFGFTSA